MMAQSVRGPANPQANGIDWTGGSYFRGSHPQTRKVLQVKFFRIRKWEKFQHYHNPRPPWIKIYTSINDQGTDWRPLKDHQLGQLLRLCAYAAHNENTIPQNAEIIKEMLGCDQDIDLDLFIKLGIFKSFGDKSSCLSIENSRLLSIKSPKKKKAPLVESSEERVLEVRDQKEDKEPSAPEQAAIVLKEFDPEVTRLAEIFAQALVSNDPKARLPKTEIQKNKWLDSIEKIYRIDGRSWKEIEAVIWWCQSDDFWKVNILSPAKLRKQFPKLLLKMGSNESLFDKRTRQSKQALEDFYKNKEQ